MTSEDTPKVPENGLPISTAKVDEDESQDYTSLKRSLSRVTNLQHDSAVHNHELLKKRSHEPIMGDASHEDGEDEVKIGGHKPNLRLNLPRVFSMTPEIGLSAMQYLPTPLVVLSPLKTILIANEAMGRLLGLKKRGEHGFGAQDQTTTQLLQGQTLSQIGVDLMSDGVPVWVSWEKFLDNISAKHKEVSASKSHKLAAIHSGETTPTANPRTGILNGEHDHEQDSLELVPTKTIVQDTVVDVVVSSQHGSHRRRASHSKSPSIQTPAKMIISSWTLYEQQYYTLSFTSASHSSHSNDKNTSRSHIVHRPSPSTSSQTSSDASATPGSSQSNSTHSSSVTSPSESTQNNLPRGAPAKCSQSTPFTDFQKITRMKDAIINTLNVPIIAMWKDGSAVVPNRATQRLLSCPVDATSEKGYDFISRFNCYTVDFERKLEAEELPILTLCRTKQEFKTWKLGIIDDKGKRRIYDLSGKPIFDEKTGEFLAGLVTMTEITEYTDMIADQNAENDKQFQLICNTMPQLMWTTRPDGYHDYFSQRWYDYTGLKVHECMGLGWKLPFHPDDMPVTVKRWHHSLATGEEYLTEYRCRRHDGVWRWMLGRALPLRDSKTGKIVKWFGTCTDIQDVVDAREESRRTQAHLLSVLRNAEMSMWAVNRDCIATFYRGDPWPSGFGRPQMGSQEFHEWFIGRNVFEAVQEFTEPKLIAEMKIAVQRILDGKSQEEIFECPNLFAGTWYRARLVPQKRGLNDPGAKDPEAVDGCIGLSMDVTGLKMKERENIRLLANETAAKEASKMKSSFLANMSHEIRTPIAGIIGMSELMLDTRLDMEQNDFAQNIQRSANSLLTVINDILDFSKIESGRLDIEEVQFSLSVVLHDVSKMLSFAAERKQLNFVSDVQLKGAASDDLILLGDPGRVRQILTNLVTNSIKFTDVGGTIKLSAYVKVETTDTMSVEFCVTDDGIGIEEEVKKRLFRPFSQADSSTARRFGGTGLGLTISKNLVDLMRGSISLESKLGNGTKATFSIPFKKPEYTGPGVPLVDIGALPDRLQSELSLSCRTSSRGGNIITPPLPSPKTDGPKKLRAGSLASIATNHVDAFSEARRKYTHILVVEDNAINQQIALKTIKNLGFSVTAVWNGQEAVDYLMKAASQAMAEHIDPNETVIPLPSLILMDVQMPVLDGYRATHTLRHHAPYRDVNLIQSIPIVAMTASAIQGDKEKCERAGMDDYMAKPVKRPLLEKMIIKWVSGSAKLRSVVEQNAKTDSNDRPDLSRSGTDHSSNCPDVEFGFKTREQVLQEKIQQTGLPPLDSLVHTAPVVRTLSPPPNSRKPSLPKSYLRSAVASTVYGGATGTETEADRGARRAEAEELATALRDAKLIDATNDPHSHDSSRLFENTFSPPLNSPGHEPFPVRERGSSADSGILALTTENVEKFNADQVADDLSSSLRSGSLAARGSAYKVPGTPNGTDDVHEHLPLPPPTITTDFVGEPTDLDQTQNRDILLDPTSMQTQLPSPRSIPGNASSNEYGNKAGRDHPEKMRKRDHVSSFLNRKRSDWSTSTAKP